MNRIKQHIPSFIDLDRTQEWVEFSNTDDLLAIEFVNQWAKPMNGKPFSHFAISDNCLMAIHDNGFHWWVVGYIEKPGKVNLPKWYGGKHKAQMPDGTIKILTTEVASLCGDTLTLKDGTKAIDIYIDKEK